MENLHVLRSLASLDNRLRQVELNRTDSSISNSDLANVPSVNLDAIYTRLSELENKLASIEVVNNRLSAVEARPVVNLDDVNSRLSAVEARPDVTQRLSALELTIASLNNS